jgi:hypothetical protein
MKKQLIISLALLAALALTACGPSEAELQSTAAAVQTGAAQTVAVQLTQNALLTPSVTNTPTPSETPTPTLTPTAGTITATATKAISGGGGTGGSGGTAGGGCDAMAFVSDVTVPDGSDYAAGATFTKTWQVRNSATCTWSTSYSVVFVSGNQMGATSPQALTASVAPGSTLDISVNMTAPSTNGSYTGYWALRNASGENFGSFYVQIDVTSGGTSGTPGAGTAVTLNAGNKTYATSGGGNGAGVIAGDDASNVGYRGLFSFDLSSIPDGATITSISLNMGTGNTTTNPFAQTPSFAPLSVQFTGGTSGGYSGSGTQMGSFSAYADLATAITADALKTAVQDLVTGGTDIAHFRVQFNTETNNDSALNQLNLFGPSLTITYTTP